jgi:hypothetical protein
LARLPRENSKPSLDHALELLTKADFSLREKVIVNALLELGLCVDCFVKDILFCRFEKGILKRGHLHTGVDLVIQFQLCDQVCHLLVGTERNVVAKAMALHEIAVIRV